MSGQDSPNVVMLVLDTTRARTVDAAPSGTYPTLERLANEGTKFTRAVTDAPWTLPAHTSLFTGTSPSTHGTHTDYPYLTDDVRTVAETFSDAGYNTASFTNNAWVSDEFGLSRGFDDLYRVWQYFQSDHDVGPVTLTESNGLDILPIAKRMLSGNPLKNAVNVAYNQFVYRSEDYGGRRTNRLARQWLDETEEPFFLFANYLEPHLEYRPPEEIADQFLDCSYEAAMDVPQDPWAYLCGLQEMTKREFDILRDLYRAEIAYADARISDLIDYLESTGQWDDSIMIVVGDHGENIGEHGLMDHQYSLHETLLHVPLYIAGGPFDGGGEVDRLVQLSDIYPTLVDVLGIDDPRATAQFQGRSFAPERPEREVTVSEYMGGQPSIETLRERFGSVPDRVETLNRGLRAIRTDDRKLIRGSDGSIRLFDMTTDPDEERDLAAEEPERVAELETRLDEWLEGVDNVTADRSVDVDEGTQARLESLGYL